MKSLEEIIENVARSTFNEPSGPAVAVIQELASEGRFSEITNFLNIWLSQNPNAHTYLVSKLPGIFLNRYLYTASSISSVKVEEFWNQNPDWVESIKSAALIDGKLNIVMAGILNKISGSSPI